MNNEKVTAFSFDPTEFPFNIELSGITNCDERYDVKREKSHCYILEYIYGGSGTVIVDGKEYHVETGDAYILPKGISHEYYPDKTWDKIWFNVDGTLVNNLIYSYGLEQNIVFKRVNNKKIFDEFYEITNSDLPIKEIMQKSAIKFHAILQLLYSQQQNRIFDLKVTAIKKMLDSNLYEKNISLKAIAKELHISQTQVISIFKKAFNMTPYQYFAKRRIEIAASLLLNSNMQVKEIAEALHYADQPYFSNAFKKIMGMSPEKYRKLSLGGVQKVSNIHTKIPLEVAENLPFNLKVDRR